MRLKAQKKAILIVIPSLKLIDESPDEAQVKLIDAFNSSTDAECLNMIDAIADRQLRRQLYILLANEDFSKRLNKNEESLQNFRNKLFPTLEQRAIKTLVEQVIVQQLKRLAMNPDEAREKLASYFELNEHHCIQFISALPDFVSCAQLYVLLKDESFLLKTNKTAAEVSPLLEALRKRMLNIGFRCISSHNSFELKFNENLQFEFKHAAEEGNLEVTQSIYALFDNKKLALEYRGYDAYTSAVNSGNLNALEWFQEKFSQEGLDIQKALKTNDFFAIKRPVLFGYLDVLKFNYNQLTDETDKPKALAIALDAAMSMRVYNLEIIAWIYTSSEDKDKPQVFRQLQLNKPEAYDELMKKFSEVPTSHLAVADQAPISSSSREGFTRFKK